MQALDPSDVDSTPLCFRPAKPEDAALLAALATQVYLETYAGEGVNPARAREVQALFSAEAMAVLLAEPRRSIVLASLRGHVDAAIGFAQLMDGAQHALLPQDGRAGCELERLYLRQCHTGQGWGRALLREAETRARERGAQRLWLTAWTGNARALAFYPRCGYRHAGNAVYRFDGAAYPNTLFAHELD